MATTIDDSAAEVNLIIHQGDDWIKTFRIGARPDSESAIVYYNMTGWTGKCQIRRKTTSADVLAELEVEIGPDQDAEETAGYLTVTLLEDDAAALPKTCFWDLELTTETDVKRTYMAGMVQVNREVTRDV